ncbi:MAG: Thiazole/oxazole-forming peptide maturase, SagD family component [Belnapia sp.]|nr:Thiazole/oxazole-forming peptide maturase, SagD family component [Belnapia sp.]
MHDTAEICEAAARRLLDPAAPATAEALDFLDWLACPVPASPGPVERNRALLLRAAARFDRLFSLDCPTAPGLAVFGAEVPLDLLAISGPAPSHGSASVSGTGASLLDAFEGCIGEGIELLSSVATAADRILAVPPRQDCTAWLDRILPPGVVPDGWVEVLRLDGPGGNAWLPAGLCLRRATPDFAPPWPLSIGCAAGPTPAAAALHGLLELIERDAAALWWRGGRRGRPVPLEDPAMVGTVALLARLRQATTGRVSWLLDLTTDLGVPVIAAISTATDGRGFCCGLAARTTRAGAARAAVLEMAQMEMAHAVVLAKQAERGHAALNPRDHALLARHAGIDAATCALLHPQGTVSVTAALPEAPDAAMAALIARLGARGLPVYALDLTRPALGVPVVRMLCPGLEVEPSCNSGPRLRDWHDRCGSNDCHANGIALM